MGSKGNRNTKLSKIERKLHIWEDGDEHTHAQPRFIYKDYLYFIPQGRNLHHLNPSYRFLVSFCSCHNQDTQDVNSCTFERWNWTNRICCIAEERKRILKIKIKWVLLSRSTYLWYQTLKEKHNQKILCRQYWSLCNCLQIFLKLSALPSK